MKKKWQAAAVIASMLSIANAPFAAGLDKRDTEFLQQAAEVGRTEIEVSKLAYQYSKRPQVREFAQMMVAEHTESEHELNALAANKAVSLSTDSPDRKDSVSRWQNLPPHEFDTRYIEELAIDMHEDAVNRFTKAAKNAADPDVKAFAAKTLPTLQRHLARGKQLQEESNNASERIPAAPQNADDSRVTSPAAQDNTGTGGGQPTNEPPPESPNKAANSQ
ncbi:DUF4142 domain-containing protein [Candidimonas sp. SYP-B2681]|uniref:DUF4142 domain-containing protein n=1 Tax=Candidimonas sp. SYP-B2681 TaxID=2497686 RepID=UPI000F89A0FE|nr:DUF4142 domain-containing protein [Candidimonas sp. SYP-B2681]RTZ47830.1 DUF4142 domain-containing protein [Candidimonas sp. SYP-B2681]